MYNNILGELWLDSSVKDKVVIGIHNLESVGGVREARYRDIRGNRYDGVHLFGPSGTKAYTVSVLNILKENDMVDHTEGQIKSGQDFYSNLLQFQYQKRKSNGHRQSKVQIKGTQLRTGISGHRVTTGHQTCITTHTDIQFLPQTCMTI